MSKFKKIVYSFILCFICISLLSPNVLKATTFNVSASTSAINIGESYTVYVGGSVTGRFNISTNNGSLSDSSIWVENNTVGVRVTPSATGTSTVTITAVDVSDNSYAPVTGSKSVSVSVTQASSSGGSNSDGGSSSGGSSSNSSNIQYQYNPETGENEAVEVKNLNLASLTVSKGSLSPSFNATTTQYTLALTSDVEKITVEAKAEDSSINVSGSGEHSLIAGSNTIDIITSDDENNSKTYTIKVNVEEKPSIYLSGVKNSGKLGILKLDSAPQLDGFEEYKIKINGKEVSAKRNPVTSLVVLYMVDKKDVRNYYIYDEKTQKVTSIYIPIALLGKNYAIITIPTSLEKREGYKFGKVKIDNNDLEGWVFTNTKYKNYSLVYLMNEKGEKDYYQYESTSNTLQPFSGVAPISQNQYEKLKNEEMVMYGLLIVSGVLVFLLFVFLIAFIKLKKKIKGKSIKKDKKISKRKRRKNENRLLDEMSKIKKLDD